MTHSLVMYFITEVIAQSQRQRREDTGVIAASARTQAASRVRWHAEDFAYRVDVANSSAHHHNRKEYKHVRKITPTAMVQTPRIASRWEQQQLGVASRGGGERREVQARRNCNDYANSEGVKTRRCPFFTRPSRPCTFHKFALRLWVLCWPRPSLCRACHGA